MAQPNRFTALGGMMAALSLAASPVSAAEMRGTAPIVNSAIVAHGAFEEDSLKAERHRDWRYRGWRHRHGIDAGDVLAGVLIIGGIAAIANAASNSERRERDDRYRDYRDERPDYRDRRGMRSSNSGRGIDSAVDMCLAEIERDVRVETVDSVDRSGEGWRVTGTIFNGDRFTCRIGEDGRIEDVDFGGGLASAAPLEDRQHSDDRYRAAWAEVDSNATMPSGERAEQPSTYPGGPVDDDVDGAAIDDRYAIAD